MCVLHVTSKTKSFTNFLNETKFPAYQSHEIGEVRKTGRKYPYDDYGFSSIVSKRDLNSLADQIEDAKTFLQKHKEVLLKMLSTHSVTDIRLDFPYYCRLDEQFFTQCDYLPPTFLKLVGGLGIGIELSLYPIDDEDSEPVG
jgi:hypothetical protein